ncbi:MAG TPA: molecular chaperone TorD family protein [Rhodocyclaceae bacterium]|nr:molecular chaperone TorD family protein [Rhodocyclaceae bacterium]HRQ45449.1 molecular chaperone TorD family protein [Rhodocyclaceae bacterium]
MNMTNNQFVDRAALHLCLSRAFLPPTGEADLEALRTDFVTDVDELAAALQLKDCMDPGALSVTLAALSDRLTLLRAYSRLFLVPPAPALLNLGLYLDGALMGKSSMEIERLYRTHGLERDANFRDGTDHLALYLQFVAWMLVRADEFVGRGEEAEALHTLADAHASITQHAAPALERLSRQIDKAERALDLPPVYGELARLTRSLLDSDLDLIAAFLPRSDEPVEPQLQLTNQPVSGHPHASISCACCGNTFIAGDELKTMIAVLKGQGLSAEHLENCPDCRAGSLGLTPMSEPRLLKKAS